jgi:hypothetical protein
VGATFVQPLQQEYDPASPERTVHP